MGQTGKRAATAQTVGIEQKIAMERMLRKA